MGWRNDQCRKVCRIIDIFLANRPTERDSLIVAVRKAFNALEQPEINCSEIPNSSDTISRQQAIDALRKMQTYKLFAGDDMILVDKAQVQTELMMLPPAQPEREKALPPVWKEDDVFGRGQYVNLSYCPRCGREIVTGDCFCSVCGQHIDWSEEDG